MHRCDSRPVESTPFGSLAIKRTLFLLVALAIVAAACGDDESTTADGQAEADVGADESSGDTEGAGGELPNACPAEGCQIFITDAAADSSGEIQLTFDANFTPDFERNHIHVFWDSQEPGAVSSDFQTRGYDIQGKWHPTDDYPSYLTQSDASTASEARGDSVKVCVTAADTDHAVIDDGIVACLDVADIVG